jgi:hypothetical protein
LNGAGGSGAGYAGQPRYVFQVSHCHSLEIDLIGEDSSAGVWQEGGEEMTALWQSGLARPATHHFTYH